MIIKNLLIFFYDFIFFGGSWVGATMMRPPSLKKRLGRRRPPSSTSPCTVYICLCVPACLITFTSTIYYIHACAMIINEYFCWKCCRTGIECSPCPTPTQSAESPHSMEQWSCQALTSTGTSLGSRGSEPGQ